jgi:Transposase IS200 like
MSQDQNHLNHATWECKYDVAITPTYRKKLLFGQIRRRLGNVFRELARRKECRIEGRHQEPGGSREQVAGWVAEVAVDRNRMLLIGDMTARNPFPTPAPSNGLGQIALSAIVPEPQFTVHIGEHACRKPPHLRRKKP